LHITDWIPGLPPVNPKLTVPEFTKQLSHDEVTIAEVLRDASYATASIGKWHLAVKFIEAHRDKPFFLYLPHFAVHTPIEAKKELIERYKGAQSQKNRRRHNNAAYAAMIDSLDQSVGRIRETVDKLGLAERTIIIFTSDNGGRVPTTSNAPLRVGKGSCYEGGVRVPLIVYWPGVTAGGGTCDVPVITMDLFSTILAITGQANAQPADCDGLSLVPLLKGTGALPDRSLFWHYPHYQHYQQGGTTPYGAIRRGDYRLIEFYDDNRVELYNVRDDIGEEHDLASQMPDLVNSLREELNAWRADVNAQIPTPNPDYDPTRPEHPAKQ
jgi:arylsulfatase A-like enzyme